MKHQTKLTLTSTTPEHIGLKNRPRVYLCCSNTKLLHLRSFELTVIWSSDTIPPKMFDVLLLILINCFYDMNKHKNLYLDKMETKYQKCQYCSSKRVNQTLPLILRQLIIKEISRQGDETLTPNPNPSLNLALTSNPNHTP